MPDPTEYLEVVGESYYTAAFEAIFQSEGRTITSRGTDITELDCVLVAEPWSDYDSNAVAVIVKGSCVGHLGAQTDAPRYSPVLIALAKRKQVLCGTARVWARREPDGRVFASATVQVAPPWAL
ncbi:MAG: hypothetical protein LBJ44_05970 [Propionibacteriaceae bacterium]|jgi:hypothetical protein|nr:hypothetical protein [Propionibacteriaceae bacterium]